MNLHRPHMIEAQGILKKYFGYDTFRQGQDELIDALLCGQDVLGIMPTGAGKSICFQVPAMMLDGITLVVSPLISLMKDQVRALTQVGISAAYINSSLSPREMDDVLYDAIHGAFRLLYVAPERLMTPSFLQFTQQANIAMVTVDEAHCISQWGQDFRPSYTQIPQFIATLSRRPILSAFTATATKEVREDILAQMALTHPNILVTGFDRKNLYFEVQEPKSKKDALLKFLKERREQSGIIYCLTRKNVETVCDLLNHSGFHASRYHAGLSPQERRENQDHFLFDRIPIMVATNAFGMGIDKANVSYVVHYNMPKDMESYYQEAGRAGRDGAPAHCLLLYSGADVHTHQFMIEQDNEQEQLSSKEIAHLRAQQQKRLSHMTYYATTTDCLRGFILRYFGEHPPVNCGHCSHCTGSYTLVDVTVESQKVLSCITRMGQRYGTTMVVDVLRGAKKQRIMELGLDTLSTYGISDKSEYFLRKLIQFLINKEYILSSDGAYPTLSLTGKAWEVLRGQVTLSMPHYPERTKEKPQKFIHSAVGIPVGREGLYKKLVATRRIMASRQGIPPFVILSDRSIIDLCNQCPTNHQELLNVYGIGEQKAQKYGDEFLQIIADTLTTF